MKLANGFDGAIYVDKAVDHHLLLLCGERSNAGDYSRLVNHFRGDMRRLGLISVCGFLRLSDESEQDAGEQRRRDTRTAAGCKKSATIESHGSPWR